jgi:FtsP/CotA-like multicopper oxidase with cupredoxin domain
MRSDPKAFTYQFDDNVFPNIPLIQPRLNSVEEWTFTDYNNDSHPIHIRINDLQVQKVVSPLIGTTTGSSRSASTMRTSRRRRSTGLMTTPASVACTL